MTHTRHADYVEMTALSPSAAALSRLVASWHRSLVKHGLAPAHEAPPSCLLETEIANRSEALGAVLDIASPHLDHVFQLVGGTGCCVILTDAEGVVLKRRAREAEKRDFSQWGLRRGAAWSEESEGTNGIGTCIAEKRPVTIFRDDHFFTRNTGMSCMDAPIFGHDGKLIAALDVSSCRSDLTHESSRLIANTVEQAAQNIETDIFRAAFPDARIIMGNRSDGYGASLIAVDADDIIVGATSRARKMLGLDESFFLAPRPATDVLEERSATSGLETAERGEVKRMLARTGGNVSATAKNLGIARATLYRRMKRLKIN